MRASFARRAEQVMERVNVSGSRFYKIDGELYPSVTTILGIINKPGLNYWIRRQSLEALRTAVAASPAKMSEQELETAVRRAATHTERIRDAAARIGTSAHQVIDDFLLLEPEQRQLAANAPDDVRNAVAAFAQWDRRSPIKLIKQDTMVFSRKYRFAGALDALGRDCSEEGQNRLIAIDWKTSNALAPEYALQVAAYSLAWTEMTGEPVHQALVVRLDKRQPEGKFEAKQVANLPATQQAFLSALHLWRALNSKLLTPATPPRIPRNDPEST